MSEPGTVFVGQVHGGWGVHVQSDRADDLDRYFDLRGSAQGYAAALCRAHGWPLVEITARICSESDAHG